MKPSSKRARFLLSYLPQEWSIPSSVIYYITKNPSNSKTWQKLIHTCKYSFAKNPVFVVNNLSIQGCFIYSEKLPRYISIRNISSKIWITKELQNRYRKNSLNPPFNLISSMIPKFYKCDVKYLNLQKQIISYNEFLFLSSNVENIYFYEITVKNNNEETVPLEKLKALPKIKFIVL